ncbi:MAG: uracil-DNA glycosylase family protein [Clostridiales bacterium]
MDQDLRNKYGYPVECKECNISRDIAEIDPFYKTGDKIKLMLIGQDPNIRKQPERVNTVLMLNECQSQLRRWLENEVFGKAVFEKIELYATNLVKCQFTSLLDRDQLENTFSSCKVHLIKELESFAPNIVITLGEPAHKLFSMKTGIQIEGIEGSMKGDFTGKFYKSKLNNTEFLYSPCLHITTFRVADSYGKSLQDFKKALSEKFQ